MHPLIQYSEMIESEMLFILLQHTILSLVLHFIKNILCIYANLHITCPSLLAGNKNSLLLSPESFFTRNQMIIYYLEELQQQHNAFYRKCWLWQVHLVAHGLEGQ